MSVLCPLCIRECFSSLYALQCRLIEACNGPLACPICDEMLMGFDKLTTHLFVHTNIKTNHTADGINATATTSDPVPSSQSQLLATNANVAMMVEDNIQRHDSQILIDFSSHCESNLFNSTAALSECYKSFKIPNVLHDHLEREHLIVINSESPARLRNDAQLFEMTNNKIVTLDNGSMKNVHKKYIDCPSNLYNASPNNSLLNTPNFCDSINEFETNNKLWKCDTCAKCFTTKYFLKKHKRLHTGEMPYSCEICGRTFTFQQSYHKHLMYHSDEKPHSCTTCGRSFKELSTLHNHERIHSGEKPYKCDVCGKCFRQRVSFLVHSRIHTGVMPYKCENCNKSFRYKVTQRTHKCQFRELEYSVNLVRECNKDTTILAEYSDAKVLSGFGMPETGHNSDSLAPFHDSSDAFLSSWDIQNIHLFSPPQLESNTT